MLQFGCMRCMTASVNSEKQTNIFWHDFYLICMWDFLSERTYSSLTFIPRVFYILSQTKRIFYSIFGDWFIVLSQSPFKVVDITLHTRDAAEHNFLRTLGRERSFRFWGEMEEKFGSTCPLNSDRFSWGCNIWMIFTEILPINFTTNLYVQVLVTNFRCL